MPLALKGVKVLDLSQVAAVPMAARHLADFGADVIHIEHPLRGDAWRVYQAGIRKGTAGPPSHINYNWEIYNRNKRSMTLDLSKERSQEVIHKLVETADVFLTNARPYELEKFDLTYDTLSHLNRKLIYGSLTGYGKKGAEKNAPGYDQTAYWYRAGTPYLLSWPGTSPPIFRSALGDHVAAMALAYGVMVALFVREKTGIGQEIDLSLFHMGIYVNSFDISGALVTGRDYKDWRPNSREDAPNALVNVYQTKDERWLTIVLLQPDRYWSRFCQAIERGDLEHDPRFESFEPRKQNHVALFHILEEVFLNKTLAEWKSRFSEAGLPFAPMQNLLEVISDPQARANDIFVPFDHPSYGRIEVIANPVNISKTPATVRMPAPELGQHTEEILLELGYDWATIDALKNDEVI